MYVPFVVASVAAARPLIRFFLQMINGMTCGDMIQLNQCGHVLQLGAPGLPLLAESVPLPLVRSRQHGWIQLVKYGFMEVGAGNQMVPVANFGV